MKSELSLARGFPKQVTQDDGWSRQGNETKGVWEGRAATGTRARGTPVSMPCRAGRPEQHRELKPGGSTGPSHAHLKGFPSTEL